MGFARVMISSELLVTVLKFPVDTRIVDADMHHSHGDVVLTLEHRDLKSVPANDEGRPPTIRPVFQKSLGRSEFHSEAVFVDWGQEP